VINEKKILLFDCHENRKNKLIFTEICATTVISVQFNYFRKMFYDFSHFPRLPVVCLFCLSSVQYVSAVDVCCRLSGRRLSLLINSRLSVTHGHVMF
jgi:hypothetical protein